MADLILRTLKYLGYDVKFVRNYTDVGHLTSDRDSGEDKMEKAIKREGMSADKIALKYIKIFEEDLKELNTIEPSAKPRATEYIKGIIEMIQTLLDKGFAYSTDLAIYFDIGKVKNYTKLSGQNLEKNISGLGKADIEDSQKKNPADFSLWFFKAGAHEKAVQYWPSPFNSKLVKDGLGFPGWHIECSAMIKKILGDTIDIHMGGVEHIPVHHTNEIAQSESANGAILSDYWLHNEWLVANDEKISKSEGSNLTLSEVKEKGFNPMALRYLFIQAHYRSKQNFTWEALSSAAAGYKHLVNSVSALPDKIGKIDQGFKKDFIEKISDDFNIPQALAVTFEVLKSQLSPEDKLATIYDFDEVLGLRLKSASRQKEIKEKMPDNVKKLADEREDARKKRDWSKSDKLRDEIERLGYEIKDTPEGTQINKK